MAVIEKARQEPNNFEAQVQAASLYAQIKRYDEAAKLLERANQLQPNDYDVLVRLGNLNFDQKRFPQAEQWYQRALKLKPDDVDVRTDLGLTYYLREPREVDKAIAAYRTSLSYNPSHEKTLLNLTSALLDRGDKAGAQKSFEQLERAPTADPEAQQLREQLRNRLRAP